MCWFVVVRVVLWCVGCVSSRCVVWLMCRLAACMYVLVCVAGGVVCCVCVFCVVVLCVCVVCVVGVRCCCVVCVVLVCVLLCTRVWFVVAWCVVRRVDVSVWLCA